jgi:hypothetical protein
MNIAMTELKPAVAPSLKGKVSCHRLDQRHQSPALPRAHRAGSDVC